MSTLHAHMQNAEFRAAYERGKGRGKATLRSKQYTIAMKGSVAMLIWLGKQYLGQHETIDQHVTQHVTWDDVLEAERVAAEDLPELLSPSVASEPAPE